MKTIIAVVGLVIVMGLVIINRDAILGGAEYVYEKEEVVKEVEVTPDWATDEEAVQAAKDVIRKKELEAEVTKLKSDWAATTADYEAQKKEYLLKKETLEKELGTY